MQGLKGTGSDFQKGKLSAAFEEMGMMLEREVVFNPRVSRAERSIAESRISAKCCACWAFYRRI
jgi:hypothetical protein